jgi:transketolase N-terminal domain/subunit
MAELTHAQISRLEEIAQQLRGDSLKLIHNRGAGHPGGALSAAEIITVLYFHSMRIDPNNPGLENRDRFILSKDTHQRFCTRPSHAEVTLILMN